ncbi:MAG: SUMF1/EgtB/PvdO family nonheme iron enzyme [Anaerolineales bacterium]|nr:SUMF1/EgtB/PvdO family nonheme iron enzyme [Anaerolineales bacterium]
MSGRRRMFAIYILLALALAACSNAAGPTPTATAAPPVLPPSAQPPAPTRAPVRLAGPNVGTTMQWQDSSTLVYVPASQFSMGDGIDDRLEHAVSLSAFWINQTEVTNRMYSLCVSTGFCTSPVDTAASDALFNSADANHPVVGVNWQQARTYCQWAGGDLPTEAQWELAARGTAGRVYPWGNTTPNCNLANFGGCKEQTARVGSYLTGPSEFGALDMAGNAAEWVQDWYSPGYYETSPQQDPTGPESGSGRVWRGGGFSSTADELASSARFPLNPEMYRLDLGFRCVVATPVYTAPYCQMNAYNQGQPGLAVSVNNETCIAPEIELRGRFCERPGVGAASFDTDRAIESVDSDILECSLISDTRIHCSGPDNSTGQVTVCSQGCEQTASAANFPLELYCLTGYIAPVDNPAVCEYGPVAHDTSGCPPGIFCTPPIDQNAACPPGLYYDTAVNVCVPVESAPNTCLPGFAYNAQAQCCQSQIGNQYPGCAEGEYYDTLLGCKPLVITQEEIGCVTFSLDTALCPEKEHVCGDIRNQLKCNQTPGCRWQGDPDPNNKGECRPVTIE